MEHNLTYLDTERPIEERVNDLVSRMTLEEKVSQMMDVAPAIERLGIPEYNWWNECLHGVARAGIATVFPQAIGLSATWNTELIQRMAVAISDEARAKHHEALRNDQHGRYYGLTYWSPNINIFRDPRWGRGQETYGEDPYLTARIGVAFVKGLQGDDPMYLKLVATPKHYAVHSGLEKERHHFDAQVCQKDLWETYLPAFEACLKEGKAYSIMGAYNRTNGEPCCASPTLLQKILRDMWEFDGYVVSDCQAIKNIHENHKVVDTPEESAAMAVKAGCDLECGRSQVYRSLVRAVDQGLITEDEIDVAVRRLFSARFKLGMFDPPEKVPYTQIPLEINDCAQHRELNIATARESIVLLKNKDGLLPLSKRLKKIAVIGPNADAVDVLLGNYEGTPSKPVTLLSGIRAKLEEATDVLFARGCPLFENTTDGFEEAVQYAKKADAVIFGGGISPRLEGEEETRGKRPERLEDDRLDLNLPEIQTELLKALHVTRTPIMLVLFNGSPFTCTWENEHLPAIIEAWYPGGEGGTAIADVLFGDYNPAGRLPITFPESVNQLPDFRDYSMAGRTYRYSHEAPLYPFGFGLSYTRFEYSDLTIDPGNGTTRDHVHISVNVKNVGERDGDEVVQLYITDLDASCRVPIRRLKGFERIHLTTGEEQVVRFTLVPCDYALVNEEGESVVEPGDFEISVGGCQPGYEQRVSEVTGVVQGRFSLSDT